MRESCLECADRDFMGHTQRNRFLEEKGGVSDTGKGALEGA